MLHVVDSSFYTKDKSEPLHQHFPKEQVLEDLAALMGELAADEEQSSLEPMSLNSSQDDRISHFHVDPITGYIATMTLNPHRHARLRPHADDM